jgi:hypothetical protein
MAAHLSAVVLAVVAEVVTETTTVETRIPNLESSASYVARRATRC